MLYVAFFLSLFEKWSLKYHFKLNFSYDLLIILIFFFLVIIYTLYADHSKYFKIFITTTALLSIFSFLFSSVDLYNFTINEVIILGGISLTYISYRKRGYFNLDKFIKINMIYIFICFVFYLYIKFICFDDSILYLINSGNGYLYPFYSSGGFSLTFSEPSFAGCYLVTMLAIIYSSERYNKTKNNILITIIFIVLIYLSKSKISLAIGITLILFNLLKNKKNFSAILSIIIISYLPLTILYSLTISIFDIKPVFIEWLPEGSKESFYTRFFFIFTRFSYIFTDIFGFSSNLDVSIIKKTLMDYTSNIPSEYKDELVGYIKNPLYFVPKDYISFITYNFGIASLIILSIIQYSIYYLMLNNKLKYESNNMILVSFLFLSFSINLTSISILMLLPSFFQDKKNLRKDLH
ncbi:hypothetical protein KKJ06_05815 [Xenorhabdus bovienii]|uniref:hypothetical protein n=1 Tax=Xenorhabdus bovienii TaxID=40576 RepID=UPI0023B2A25B|nr:hypothetical protein [Xenorhabdus bovienii]MDE9554967.1 hypothetical protein [Xenorhabdus bovienii]